MVTKTYTNRKMIKVKNKKNCRNCPSTDEQINRKTDMHIKFNKEYNKRSFIQNNQDIKKILNLFKLVLNFLPVIIYPFIFNNML